jgi:hypothetical protein
MQNPRKSYHRMFSPSAIAEECRDLITVAAGPREWNDTRESWLGRAARYLGIDYSRAYNIFYGRSRRIEASEYLTIKHRVNELRARQAANREALDHVASQLASMGSGEATDPFRTP